MVRIWVAKRKVGKISGKMQPFPGLALLTGGVRTALIAACLCAALAGAAFAVEASTGFSSILSRIDPEYQERRQTDETYSGYVAVRGNKGVSLENIPEEISAKVKNAPHTLLRNGSIPRRWRKRTLISVPMTMHISNR